MCDESSYISKPISTIQELVHWDFPSTSNLTIPLSYFSDFLNDFGFIRKSSGLPKVIYCHDMAGGYLSSDRTVNFTCVFPAFRFVHWHLVDIFIYFSHQFITIPPVSWINLAHRQGVSVYGTVIMESVECDGFKFIFMGSSEHYRDVNKISNYKDFAIRLDQIRRVVGFEGWFINFEISLPWEEIATIRDRIKKFLRMLRNLGSEVIWYDALTWSGHLSFQNELTEENLPYMKASGSGLFLNYNWNPVKLRRSQEVAVNSSMSTKVFVGIDCFGRGCIGGGGFGTVEALKVVLDINASRPDRPLSVALFAPGWVFEKCDLTEAAGDPIKAFSLLAEMNTKFWSYLSPLICRLRGLSSIDNVTMLYKPTLPSLPVIQLPCDLCEKYDSDILFCTTCCSGQGLLPPKPSTAQNEMILQYGSQMGRQQAVQILETGYEKFTGTCLCIRFEQSDKVVDFEQQKSNDSLMELFLFGRNSFISDKAQFKLAITPYTLNKETSLPSEQRLDHKIGLKLFVDTFHFPDKNDGEINFKRTFLTADEERIELKNNIPWSVLHYNVTDLIFDPNKNISESEKFSNTTSSSHCIHLHRIGLTWSWNSILHTYDKSIMKFNGFLIGLIELRDPQWPLENYFE
ncbi:mannosyl-glycoprotein endo-beta-N-acetylglucosaminidase [Schistosoma bovis]|uniref:Mannosyl-glycoprotein endo-beta-N-acetylglucosaminidase n=1 Tax=Schistosoma bovis TaxID=6184 RepID=A0A430QRP5_SCHBO|nr:mannosyl-glycoprotein endo-beta-N-acetylglucosaminidase [Schistosoma bovis]